MGAGSEFDITASDYSGGTRYRTGRFYGDRAMGGALLSILLWMQEPVDAAGDLSCSGGSSKVIEQGGVAACLRALLVAGEIGGVRAFGRICG